jgi:hypothetical protein
MIISVKLFENREYRNSFTDFSCFKCILILKEVKKKLQDHMVHQCNLSLQIGDNWGSKCLRINWAL